MIHTFGHDGFKIELKLTIYTIYILCLSIWVCVCLYPINAKRVKLIGSIFLWDPREGLRMIKFSSIEIQYLLKFSKFSKYMNFFLNLGFSLQCIQRETVHWN